MSTLRRILAVLIIAAMALSLVGFTGKPETDEVKEQTFEDVTPKDPHEIVNIVVKLTDKPVLASYKISDTRAQSRSAELRAKQDSVISAISEKLLKGAEVSLSYHYTLLFNGFSIRGEYRLIEEIKKLPGVMNAYESWSYELPEDVDPDGEASRLATSVGWINATDLWGMGYTGQGQTIAVIDTGILKTHPNFAAAPVDPHFNAANLQTVLDNNDLCAEERYTGGTLTGNDLYYSAKIPFTYNYRAGNLDVSHANANSDHGTHVSSIAAGNDSSARGVAYNAQILAMQVFYNGNAEWVDILAALEDCAYLQVDALNMSLGADCGFTHDEDLDPTFDLLVSSGVNCAVASGNSGYAGGGNLFNGTNPTFNFDNGVTSSPASAVAALCVAASLDSAAATPTSYSSWGTTSDLRIKPEIMAPGDNINAATDPAYSYSNYSTKSGTSMATPHIAGSMVLVNQYVNANFPNLGEQAKMEMVNTLLMCTAVPTRSSGVPYSPRWQGAGQADLLAAISTKAYIDVPTNVRPKLELGDDDEMTGIFTLTFDVVNFGNTALTYTVQPQVLTEATNTWLIGGQPAYVMDHNEEDITSRVSIQKPNTITVPAGGRTTVTVVIDINNIAAELHEKWPLGAYIEGYVKLDGTVDLSVPFLGFYGDWEYAAVMDRKCYYDNYNGNTLTYPNQWGTNVAATKLNGSSLNLGLNPFAETTDFLLDRASISPNGDNKMERIETVHTYMLRNAETFRYEILDAVTGEQYYVQDVKWIPKGVENTWLSYYQPVGAEEWTMMEPWNGGGLANGTSVILRMTAWMQGWDEFDPAENEFASWEVPVTIDTENPEVVYWNMQGGSLDMYVSDNHYVAYVGVYSNASCTNLIAEEVIEEHQRGALSMLSFDVGNYSTVYVKVGDYAANSVTQTVTQGEGGSIDPVDLTGVHFEHTSVIVYEGFSAELRLIREPANANNFETTWTSANTNIATVTGGMVKGTVTGVSEGTTTVTAHVRDKRTGATYDVHANVEVRNFPTLDEALNAVGSDIHFINNSSYPWDIEMNIAVCGKSTNQNVASSSSYIQTPSMSLEAGDKVVFRWMVSSEQNYDFLKFMVNSSVVASISGVTGWAVYEYTVPNSGNYTFKWSYEKDSSVNKNDDTGWVDDIEIVYVNPPYTLGDIDGNNNIDSADALIALRYALGAAELTPMQLLAADVDGDGQVTTSDALLILRFAMGVIASF